MGWRLQWPVAQVPNHKKKEKKDVFHAFCMRHYNSATFELPFLLYLGHDGGRQM